MSRRLSKAKLVIALEEAEAQLLSVMLNKGYEALQIELKDDELGSTLTIGAWVDKDEDNPPWSPVRIVEDDKELSYKELLEKLGLSSESQNEKSSYGNCNYFDGGPIPF